MGKSLTGWQPHINVTRSLREARLNIVIDRYNLTRYSSLPSSETAVQVRETAQRRLSLAHPRHCATLSWYLRTGFGSHLVTSGVLPAGRRTSSDPPTRGKGCLRA